MHIESQLRQCCCALISLLLLGGSTVACTTSDGQGSRPLSDSVRTTSEAMTTANVSPTSQRSVRSQCATIVTEMRNGAIEEVGCDQPGLPVLARRFWPDYPQGFERVSQAIALYGWGYLDLSGPCAVIAYPLNEQFGLLDLQRVRQYPFPGGIDVERFTLVAPERAASAGGYGNWYFDVRDDELALVWDRYKDGALEQTDIYRHGDPLATELPTYIGEWLIPVPSACPSQWMWL